MLSPGILYRAVARKPSSASIKACANFRQNFKSEWAAKADVYIWASNHDAAAF